GAGAFLGPLAHRLRRQSLWIRGACYTLCIFVVEFLSGSFLKRRQICPWDYSRARFNVGGVIRLDYAPAWFILGLILEKILAPQRESAK
ncbi:MAG: putative ABC transporter permease, partial [Lachnospiraceae bacterium]|nr:putative ABC transporter permease [Lachnospiraceae bacterium]